jgi:site-specific DNA recombinase
LEKKIDGSKTYWKYLKCNKYRRSSKCVNHPPITYENFREIVLQKLKEETKKESFNLGNNLTANDQIRIKQIKKEIDSTNQKIDRLLDIYLEGILNKYEYEIKREVLKKKAQSLQDELFILKRNDKCDLNINTINKAIEQLNNKEQDLYNVFNTLMEYGILYEDGSVDLIFTFNKM